MQSPNLGKEMKIPAESRVLPLFNFTNSQRPGVRKVTEFIPVVLGGNKYIEKGTSISDGTSTHKALYKYCLI